MRENFGTGVGQGPRCERTEWIVVDRVNSNEKSQETSEEKKVV